MIKFLSYLEEAGKTGDHSHQKTKNGQPRPSPQPLIKINPCNNPDSKGQTYTFDNFVKSVGLTPVVLDYFEGYQDKEDESNNYSDQGTELCNPCYQI